MDQNVLRGTRLGVVPKQTRPNMVVKTFRVPEKLWQRVVARCQAEDENPSDVIRRALEAYAEENNP